ncbi:MAG: hypothetical protein KJ927_09765 [Candidatus Eisenbacteria bacterium]|nr:hypothetical protein [Candidatus Eisenbacteria bacterium]MBU1948987.1 hypothetical protein [Candidatus Eisenbacteria bacterium]
MVAILPAGPLHLFLCALILLTGCSTYQHRIAPVREFAAQGEMERALDHVAKMMKPGDLLYHLETGMLLHLMERYEESDAQFDLAELLIEDLYTKSLSRKGFSYLLNEEVEAYDGEPFERFLINYYRALNHLHMGHLTGALVEARKIDLKWALQADSKGNLIEQGRLPFVEYFAALLHEEGGELNDALVSLRLAEEAYSRLEDRVSAPEPPWLAADLDRVALKGGFTDFIEKIPRDQDQEGIEEGQGEIVLLLENGWIPIRGETRISIPLLESESDIDDDGVILLAGRLHHRYETHRMHGAWFPERVKITYWLEVALPFFPPLRPLVVQTARLSSGSLHAETIRVEDLGVAAQISFEAQEGEIIMRAIVRALLKYIGHRLAEKSGGAVAGFLANFVGVATETADTRAWSTLPREFQMARLFLPEGSHPLTLDCLGSRGEIIESVDLGTVEVEAGRRIFINWRAHY